MCLSQGGTAVSSQGSNGYRSTWKFTHLTWLLRGSSCWNLLMGCCPEANLRGPLPRVAHNVVLTFNSRSKRRQTNGLRKITIVNRWHLTEVRKWRQWMNKNIWARQMKGRRKLELYLEEEMLLIGVEPSEKSSKIILLQPDIVTLGNNYAYFKLY